jgi:uncharacterized protein (TIGR03437 family)
MKYGKGMGWGGAARAALVALGLAAGAFAAPFGRVIPIGGHSSDLALDDSRGVIYVANFTARRIEVISLATGALQTPMYVPNQPGSIDVSPDRKYLIAGHYGNFESPLSPANGITIIELATRTQRNITLGAPVLGVGFGSDGKALVITNKEFLLFDPVSGNSELIDTISNVNAQNLPVDIGKAPPDITEASLAVSEDRNFIYALGGHEATATFKYDVKSRTVRPGGVVLAEGVLGPRVVSMNHNGTRTFAGWVMVDQNGVFSNFFRTVTNEFSVGTTAFDDRRNIVYAQMPMTEGEAPTLMITDADNLAVLERMQLAENLTGKSILSKDGNTMYSISASGITVFPIGALNSQPRIAATPGDVVFRGNFCDRVSGVQVITIANPGGGAVDFSLSTDTPGITFSRTQGTTPASIAITVDPLAFQNVKGTRTINVKINSAAAVNVIRPIRLLINNREPDQRGAIVNVSGQLVDIIADPARDRFYILRQDTNQILVFDGTTLRQFATLKTYNSPTSLAITADKRFLLVGHDSAQVAGVYELDTLRQLPYIATSSGSGNVAHHIVATENAILAATTDYQNKGHIIELSLDTRNSTQLASLGPYTNEIDIRTVGVAPWNGKTAFFPSEDGNVLLYDAASRSFSISRKDFEQLAGGYGASEDGNYFVGNYVLNSSLVPIGSYDDAGGKTGGVGFLGANGYRVTATAAADPGGLHRLAGAGHNLEITQPARTIEAPNGGLTATGFARTVAALSNGRTVVVLSASGFTAIPTDYANSTAIPTISAVVSAADLSTNVATGGLVSVFGSKLSTATLAASTIPVPSVLGDSCVTVNDVPTPLLFVSPGQINAQLPYGLNGDAKLILRTPGGVSAPTTVKVRSNAPAVFQANIGAAGVTPAIVRANNNQLVTLSNPIHRGDSISIYLTGLGETRPAVTAGQPAPADPLAAATTAPLVSLGGVPLILEYAGLSPGSAGVYQINARVPFPVPLGVGMPLTIQQGGAESPISTVGVRVVD